MRRWIPVALAVLVVAVYARTAAFDFVNYDDPGYVYDNPLIAKGLSWGGVAEVFLHGQMLLWVPLTSLSYMLGCSVYGLSAGAHHATNVAFHLANVLLLFWVLRRMTGAVWPSAFVAAVFAAHPLNVEAVAWVSGRKEVLYATFWLLGMAAYGRRYWLTCVCHGLGLAAKTSQMTFPAVLLLLDYWPLGARKRVSRLLVEKLPLVVLSIPAAMSAYWLTAQGKGGMQSLEAVPFATRMANTAWVYGWYVLKLFWPSGLAVHYPYPSGAMPGWQVGIACALLIGVSAACIVFFRSYPWLAVGWFWFVVSLFPVSGMVRAATFLMADRYAYVPMIGLLIMLAWGGAEVARRVPRMRRVVAVCALAYVLAMGVWAGVQTQYWRNSMVLFNHALDAWPENALAYKNLGTLLAGEQRYEQAMEAYRKGLAVNPKDSELHASLGSALVALGRGEEALAEYRAAVAIAPDFAGAQYDMGNLLARQRKFEEAAAAYSEALRLEPRRLGAAINLGNSLASLGRFDEAATYYLKATEIDPASADAYVNLGRVRMRQHRYGDAVDSFAKAVERNPGNAAARRALDEARAALGR